jgi:hypothetical protein
MSPVQSAPNSMASWRSTGFREKTNFLEAGNSTDVIWSTRWFAEPKPKRPSVIPSSTCASLSDRYPMVPAHMSGATLVVSLRPSGIRNAKPDGMTMYSA